MPRRASGFVLLALATCGTSPAVVGAPDAVPTHDTAMSDAALTPDAYSGGTPDADPVDAMSTDGGSGTSVTTSLTCSSYIVDEKPSKNQTWTFTWGSVAVSGSDYAISGDVTGTNLTYFPTLGVCWSGDTCTGTYPPRPSPSLAVYVCTVTEQVYSTGAVLGTDGSNDVTITTY